jgi:dihydropteroate synthase
MVDKEIPLIEAKKTSQKDVALDPNGFFVIEVYQKGIRVEYYSNVYKGKTIVSGHLEKVFIGKKANALSDTIAQHVTNLRREHYLYLGRELQRAQCAFEKKKKYVQDGC